MIKPFIIEGLLIVAKSINKFNTTTIFIENNLCCCIYLCVFGIKLNITADKSDKSILES